MVTSKQVHRIDPRDDEGEQALSLGDIVRVILNRLWIIVLVVFLLVGLALGYTLAQTPTYEASVKVLVAQKQEEGSLSSLGSDVEGLQYLTKTFTQAVDTRPVAEVVIGRLNLEMTPDDLLKNLEAQHIPDTQFIQLNYEDSSPERAQLVANTTGQVLSDLVSKLSPDAYGVTATVWEPAETPSDPVSPNWGLNVFMALVVGVALGVMLAFLLEYLGGGADRK
jgi:capsular polysaccharide biosynthesis protein